MPHDSDFIILNMSKENKFDDHVAKFLFCFMLLLNIFLLHLIWNNNIGLLAARSHCSSKYTVEQYHLQQQRPEEKTKTETCPFN